MKRPLAYRFDFVELFAGSAKVTKYMSERGWSVGPPIDLSHSREYDLTQSHVMSWLSHLICTNSIKSFACEPPCTTFSIMRRPQLRSKRRPYGFDVNDPQTPTGTTLALRGLQCLSLGLRYGVSGWLETPFSSRLKSPPYEDLRSREGVDFCRTDSCRFGSVHLKPFAFLSVWAPLKKIRRRCSCLSRHVVIGGRAEVLEDAIRARALADEDWQSVKVHGLENALTNQVALEAEWSVRRCWSFRKPSHINIQESVSVLRVTEFLSKKRRSQRSSILVDSNVVRCAVSKGRTSSRGLMPVIAKINAIALGAGLYLCLPFCPTKVNPSDDPTRSTELRSAVKGLDLKTMTKEQALALSESAGLRRWAANWIRLTVRLSGISILELGDRSKNRSPCILDFRPSLESFFPMDFDQTLGYPGEGPWPILFPVLLCAVLLLSRPGRSGHPPSWTSVAIWGASLAMAAPLKPRNAGDKLRANIRDLRPPLPSGRPVLKSTEKRREFLFSAFKQWVEERGLLFSELFGNTYQNIEEINTILTAYGRELYRSGRPQNHFSETINSIASWKPQLRRVLQGAWDLAYTWVKLEPSIHHTAMPAQVLLSFLSVCLAWGWVRFGGCIALAWGGLLRPGELLSAKRCHLQLPSDVRFSVPFILLSILEPKSRHTTARRQCAKLDTPDLVQMVELAFSRMQPDEPLWGRSGQTLRARFRSVMEALCLPTTTCKGVKALDLGSLRPGGATHLLQTTESGDLVMRRGRWASYRVMSIYIQEVSATSYLSLLEPDVRDKVLTTAACFPAFLEKAEHLDRAEIPKHVWYFLFTATQ